MAEQTSVEVKARVVFLRTQSDYVTKLTTVLGTLLRTIEHALDEPNTDTQAVVTDAAEQLAELQRLLAQEASVLSGRLEAFLTELPSSSPGQSLKEP